MIKRCTGVLLNPLQHKTIQTDAIDTNSKLLYEARTIITLIDLFDNLQLCLSKFTSFRWLRHLKYIYIHTYKKALLVYQQVWKT